MATLTLLLTVMAAFGGILGAERFPIRLVDNGYENILIAIRSDVKENHTLIDAIKEYFTEASAALYRATMNRTYFRNITIFVPASWGGLSNTTQASEKESFSRANVIVANMPDGAGPYTKQKRGCRQPGEFIHLPPRYLLDRQFAETNFGPVGKTLVHEWSHLRWGLLNEHPGEDFAHCQVINGQVVPVKCSVGMEVDILPDPSGKYGCKVVPKANSSQSAKASMLYAPHLRDVYTFCDSRDHPDEYLRHNADVLNEHNHQCNGESAWEIMRKHKDFKDGANAARDIADTKPSFSLVQCKEVKIVLILDVSGSMNSNDRIEKLNSAAKDYVRDVVPNNAYVMIILFSSDARVVHNFTQVKNPTDRESLASKVPNTASGSTCIGCGLKLGLDELQRHGDGLTKGHIFMLLCDGKESTSGRPNIAEIKSRLLSSGVIVNTLLLSNSAEKKLTQLSAETSADSQFVQDGEPADNLYNAFRAARTCLTNEVFDEELQLESLTRTPKQGIVIVDSSANTNTKFIFTWSSVSVNVNVRLMLPNGTNITQGSLLYKLTGQRIMIKIPEAEVGTYTYFVDSSSRLEPISLAVFGGAPTSDIIALDSTINTVKLDLTSDYGIVIYGDIRKSYDKAIIKAKVTATISGGGVTTTLELKDNGIGLDLVKDDGIYTGFYWTFRSTTNYNVYVNARSVTGISEIKSIQYVSAAAATPLNFYDKTAENATTDSETFVRVKSAGYVPINSLPIAGIEDRVPPSRIKDLRVVNISLSDRSFCLLWTAMGNNYDSGRVWYNDIRVCEEPGRLRENFTLCDPVRTYLAPPKASGEIETVCLPLAGASANSTHFSAVVSVDGSGNRSPVSNVVQILFTELSQFPTSTAVATETTTPLQSSTNAATTPQQTSTMSATSTSNSPTESLTSMDAYMGVIISVSVVSALLFCGVCMLMVFRFTRMQRQVDSMMERNAERRSVTTEPRFTGYPKYRPQFYWSSQ